ncbi:MAG TPA: DoxX family protein [Candidatus Polarisedimenticolaceae bacterium]|nr:DoxX family protein [Candidatus Polarisedimenticolaceae bacterium]
MLADEGFKATATRVTFFLLRVVSGLLFFHAGAMKLLGWFGGMPGNQPSPPPLTSQVGIAGILELFGGILIMLGLLTRPVAFILSGEMAVAYWQFHAPNGTWPIQNRGEAAVLLCFIFLYMAAHGGGDWSVDALIRRRLKRTPV